MHWAVRLGARRFSYEAELLQCGAVPVNENAKVAVEVAAMLGASCLFLLTDMDAVYTANPAREPGARRIAHVIRSEAPALLAAQERLHGVEGRFSAQDGVEWRGVCNYSSAQVARLLGRRSGCGGGAGVAPTAGGVWTPPCERARPRGQQLEHLRPPREKTNRKEQQ